MPFWRQSKEQPTKDLLRVITYKRLAGQQPNIIQLEFDWSENLEVNRKERDVGAMNVSLDAPTKLYASSLSIGLPSLQMRNGRPLGA